jgi:hypothetical protein
MLYQLEVVRRAAVVEQGFQQSFFHSRNLRKKNSKLSPP